MAANTGKRTIADLSVQLESLTKKMDDKLDDISRQLARLVEENTQLKSTLKLKDTEIMGLKRKINAVEQHQRSFSIRINNLPLPDGAINDPKTTIQQVYDLALSPILRGAAQKGKISTIPTPEELIEVAHPLPGKQGKPRPVIVRFFNRNAKAVILANRKEFATRLSPGGKGKIAYPIFEDLTRDTFSKMKSLGAEEEVESCWSVAGQIRFKKVGSEVIHKVDNIYLPNEDILS